MAKYTCEFSKIEDGDSTKYVQVPNENTAKRKELKIIEKYHTPLRNLDKYKITKQSKVWSDDAVGQVVTTVTYARDFKSDQKGVVTEDNLEEFIFCAFKQEKKNNDVIYIKHDDLTNAEYDKPNGKYPVYTKDKTGENATFTKDTTTYTFHWL